MNRNDLKNHETEIAIAAAIALTAGIAIALMMRPKRHPLQSGMHKARKKMMLAGEHGLDRARDMRKMAMKRARKGINQGMHFLEDLPIDDIGDQLQDYLDSAKEAIEDTINGELQDLQKSIKRRRKRMGF